MIHPAIRDLFQSLGKHAAFQEALRRISAGEPRLLISGLTPPARALHAVLLWQLSERPVIVVTSGSREAESLLETAETFFDLLVSGRESQRPQLIPSLDVLPNQGLSPHAEICEQRAVGLYRLAAGQSSVTIVPLGAASFRVSPPAFYEQLAVSLEAGEEIPLDDLTAHLTSVGYRRREPVESVGEYSVRGGILDVFPPGVERPVRVEFFGDQIESMRRFDIESQRSISKVTSCRLLPLSEFQRPGETGEDPGWELASGARTLPLFSLAEKPLIVWSETESLAAASERLWTRLRQHPGEIDSEALYFDWDGLREAAAGQQWLDFRQLALEGDSLHIGTRPSMAFHGNMQAAISEARSLVDSGQRVVFFAPSAGELERLADVLNEYSVPYQLALDPASRAGDYLSERAYFAGTAASTFLVRGAVRKGTAFTDARITVIGSDDLFDRSALVAEPGIAKSHLATFSADTLDLQPGDFIVHAEHGVGQFLGLREIAQGDAKGDFMLIEYSGGSKLYVPLARMDLVQRFRGSGDAKPALDRLGGVTWTKTKTRVKARMRDMAEELLKLYAQRRMAEGFSYSPDSDLQREFEDAFEYSPTRDQTSAVRDIKRDMESPQPMDRLVCGDVGFGKTEVVMRAAFKALGDGKQVAVLAPTTVLCFQHFETFKRRFQPFPVRVEMFSRFRTARELKALTEELGLGRIDIAIGTHRLLSADVQFADLGLVIIDEEQRFGVKHKEKLKQFKQTVDVIAMSATPIPRTLHMSLLGMRDMSVIETPPKDRLAIQTTVSHYNPEVIQAAIELELGRGGQVYYIHNRVDSIWARAAEIQQLVPQARIGVGHGQMGESELERTMLAFMRHEYNILVSTTIVENGLDIPLANTIVIENAQNYGLSELYQLRGRVGRSNRRAYAYLLVPPDTELSEIARKRLAALKEFSDLGAGFKIAALDLELRGAGNLLGGEQHGHIDSVGFDMYVRLLDETVRELKGEEVPPEIHATLNLGLDVRIPTAYIADDTQRLRVYKRIAAARDDAERTEVAAEIADRYGPLPEAVRNLLDYGALKTAAELLGIENIERRGGTANVKFHRDTRVDPQRLMQAVTETEGAQFTPAGVLRVPLPPSRGAEAIEALRGFLVRLRPV
ncbi:MAG: transcription-repair coupling factor [Bryobacterales bacterium]|nr:transcription-repair coupling factor [Bryobacterales bacterium]